MMKRYAFSFALLWSLAAARAQYCSPTFDFGCFNWGNQAISAGTIDWTFGVDPCETSDYTGQSTTVNAGDDLAMSVTSGVWCGCAVWIDLDNSTSFEDGENMYYMYVGGDPGHTYDFNISIPGSTPTGSYRMRVVAPWGSDGFLNTNTNGYGPCGSYQYGNFKDFTVNVIGSNGMQEAAAASFTVARDAANGLLITSASTIEEVVIQDMQGRIVQRFGAQSDCVAVDASPWASGAYLVSVLQDGRRTTQRISLD